MWIPWRLRRRRFWEEADSIALHRAGEGAVALAVGRDLEGLGDGAELRVAAKELRHDGLVLLLLERDGESRAIPVADFASVSNVDDPAGWFSLWF